MSEAMPAIEARGLSKRFAARTAVADLSLRVEEGECLALLGLNGAGKTTTIRMLTGLLPPDAGTALVFGLDMAVQPAAAKALLNVSPQETAVAPRLSVQENLETLARIYGASKAKAHIRVTKLMAEFGLTERAHDRAAALSGGLQRRLSIAMALVSEPRVVFLDEPTLGLDVRARRDLWRMVAALKGRITLVLTTHYLDEVEALADRVAVIAEGKLCALGSVPDLLAATNTAKLEDAFLALTDEEEAPCA